MTDAMSDVGKDGYTAALELALSEMRRSMDVGLAQIQGDLRLLLQRADQTDRRAEQHATRLDALEGRVRDIEQSAVAETVVDAVESRVLKLEQTSVTKTDLDDRTKRIIAILSVIIAAAGVAVAVVAVLVSHH
ncbi:hypothetical protein [Actinoallomurus sp. NPDC052274]|uniref:hypothetical protein n=1 Tax=Actinoallomurus sp. NPDC052274 TaxID=3155420 RepID=UPI0034391FE1